MPSYFSINLHINILDENTEKKSPIIMLKKLNELLTWCNETMMMRSSYSLIFPNFVLKTIYNCFYVILYNHLIL